MAALCLTFFPGHPLGTSTPTPISATAACLDSTDAVTAMPHGVVRLDDGRQLNVRIAETPAHRQAGMQHLCPEAIAQTPILFLFDAPTTPRFHMDNVHTPLDIVFVSADGLVVAVDRMAPSQSWLTAPPGPVIAALEMAAGGADTLNLDVGQTLQWAHDGKP